MAFPCPAADSLAPMDHLLSFDVTPIIPKNIRILIYEDFSPITVYIHGSVPYSRVHRDVYINPNPFGLFLDLDPTHMTRGLPYALRSHGFDLSISLWKAI